MLAGSAATHPRKWRSLRHKERPNFNAMAQEEITFTFDTVYVVRKAREDIDLMPLRAYLSSIGDSLVIGEDDKTTSRSTSYRHSRQRPDRSKYGARWSWRRSRICALRPTRWPLARPPRAPMIWTPLRKNWKTETAVTR